ncbi:MAG: hypothetical protein A2Y82_03670 [Candidatus Buchananbacteria bacterium RBG_13_36_9]|uniref:Uncharacterized protein n=1 Tax=Candidatus Buchananbacteria bacterium RBG_13_36_9 TaxID=1797530 RepID=A0A1G1XLH0_9BACT|nr:MAG: hypothetical protein A2Y82_03670 [Candidatus Buchananbacteria bacterium RBG_13_36_9]
MSEEKYRFLIEDKVDGWKIKIIPKGDVQNWIRGNPEAILIRFAVVLRSGAGNLPCETKEEALQRAKVTGDLVQVIKPNEAIFAKLPQKAIDLIYQC